MTKLYSTFLLASLFFSACKSVSKSYNKGDYDSAIELGIKKLQKDPSDSETKDLIKSAYTYAVNEHEAAIRNLSNSANDNRYEAILREYNKLQELYDNIHQSPVAVNAVHPADYSGYVQTYRTKAAEVHLVKAEKLMEEGSKKAYREAYYQYGYALRYQNTEDIKRKRDEAFNAALVKVLVVPIQNYGGYSYHSDYQLRQFQDAIMRTLAYNMNDNFVRFYSEWDLRNKNDEADQILEMNLGRIRIGQPYDERQQREVSKEVVTKEIVYKADSVVKQYSTVKAIITTTKRTLLSQGDLYLTIRDPRGRTLWTDRFTGEHRWRTEFATYTGDERALSENDKSLLNRNKNYNTPNEDEIMAELYRQIQNDLSNRLRNYFTRF